jgi:hypothetical protein
LKLNYRSNYNKLIAKLDTMQKRVPQRGILWAMNNAKAVDQSCRDTIKTESRTGREL